MNSLTVLGCFSLLVVSVNSMSDGIRTEQARLECIELIKGVKPEDNQTCHQLCCGMAARHPHYRYGSEMFLMEIEPVFPGLCHIVSSDAKSVATSDVAPASMPTTERYCIPQPDYAYKHRIIAECVRGMVGARSLQELDRECLYQCVYTGQEFNWFKWGYDLFHMVEDYGKLLGQYKQCRWYGGAPTQP